MKAVTHIDNVTLQITCDSKDEQREKLDELLAFIKKKSSLKIVYPDYKKKEWDIKIRSKRNTIATIKTGAFYAGKDIHRRPINKWYISIRFKGLSRYIKRLDKLSNELLLSVAAYMKTRGIKYALRALDICIDLECRFENMLTICTIKSPKVEYYSLTEKQVYVTTNYIEKISKKKLKKAALRSYFYYKTRKDELDFPLSRFELKLNSRFLNSPAVLMDRIENALDKYYVMYFKDIRLKHAKVKEYTKHKIVRQEELEQLNLEPYRVFADLNYIEHFLNLIFTIDESVLSVDGSDI